MVKNIVRALLIGGVIVVATNSGLGLPAEARSAKAGARDSGLGGVQDGVRDSDDQRRSIVGSWIGTLDNGERILMSFTSDGIAFSTIQGEVRLTLPVLTPAHGAWTHLGGRRFALTLAGILYDVQTGGYQGAGKVRGFLTLDRSGDGISATVTVEIFGPDGTRVAAIPHTIRFTRINVELPD